MSIADYFDHGSGDGFVRAYDARAARRQFQISIGLVAVIALAAVVVGTLARLDPPATGRPAASPYVAETLLDIRS